MVSRLKTRHSLELLKILADGEWHDTRYLALAAGKYIPPERASRILRRGHGQTVESGRSNIIANHLAGLLRTGRVEKRRDGPLCEWRLKDVDWALRMLKWAGEPIPPSMPPTLERKTISLSSAHYDVFSEVKQAYERATGKSVTWDAFLIELVGSSLAGKSIRKGGGSNERR